MSIRRNSVMLFNEITRLQKAMRDVPEKADDRAEQLYTLAGRIEVLQDQLAETLADEQNARVMPNGKIVGGGANFSVTEQFAGPRSQFKGIQPGFRAAVTIPGAGWTEPDVPAFPDAPRQFIDTLIQAPCEGSVTYLRRGAKTNAAAQWSSGSKAESSYAWTEQTAPLTWIAHHTPISKTQASDWGQLDSAIRTELMSGLQQVKSREALIGANESGVIGVLNTAGILTHTVAAGDNVYDAIRRMATRVRAATGFMPTHVAMCPQVSEAMDLLKDKDDGYLRVNAGGKVWNLQIVEDASLAVHDDSLGLTRLGVLVYSPMGATWYTKEQDNVEMGLVEDQFIKNAYTLLAECRGALAIKFPDAFCYCQDAIAAIADESS